jgi:hypothetical protein
MKKEKRLDTLATEERAAIGMLVNHIVNKIDTKIRVLLPLSLKHDNQNGLGTASWSLPATK